LAKPETGREPKLEQKITPKEEKARLGVDAQSKTWKEKGRLLKNAQGFEISWEETFSRKPVGAKNRRMRGEGEKQIWMGSQDIGRNGGRGEGGN